MNLMPRAVLNQWSEARILDYFWKFGATPDRRLELLRRMAEVKVLRPDGWSALEVREVDLPKHPEQCWCCLSIERWTYWHHVIAVQHGGDSHSQNIVAICHRCHTRIHPWLADRPLETKSGFHWIGDMVAPALVRLEAAWAAASLAPESDWDRRAREWGDR